MNQKNHHKIPCVFKISVIGKDNLHALSYKDKYFIFCLWINSARRFLCQIAKVPNFFVLQEDAVTALKLYKKYLELKSQDKLIEALNGLYDKGKACSWRTPEDDDWAGIIFL